MAALISVRLAIDKEQARDVWINKLEVKAIESFTVQDKEEILKDNFFDEDIIPIKEVKNVWFFYGENKKRLWSC